MRIGVQLPSARRVRRPVAVGPRKHDVEHDRVERVSRAIHSPSVPSLTTSTANPSASSPFAGRRRAASRPRRPVSASADPGRLRLNRHRMRAVEFRAFSGGSAAVAHSARLNPAGKDSRHGIANQRPNRCATAPGMLVVSVALVSSCAGPAPTPAAAGPTPTAGTPTAAGSSSSPPVPSTPSRPPRTVEPSYAPVIDPARFSTTIDNPYYPSCPAPDSSTRASSRTARSATSWRSLPTPRS